MTQKGEGMTSQNAPSDAPLPGSLNRNTAINVIGALAPMLVSLLTLPPYLRVIGEVRFGVPPCSGSSSGTSWCSTWAWAGPCPMASNSQTLRQLLGFGGWSRLPG